MATIIGGGGNNTLVGTTMDDLIKGKGGADELLGKSGDDVLLGGGGKDLLKGGKGADELFGGGNDDKLKGGKGADILDGGKGNDIMKGGDGKDIFVFGEDDGMDTITDFDPGKDILEIKQQGGINDQQDALNAAKQDGDDVVINLGNGNKIILKNTDVDDLDEDDFNIT